MIKAFEYLIMGSKPGIMGIEQWVSIFVAQSVFRSIHILVTNETSKKHVLSYSF